VRIYCSRFENGVSVATPSKLKSASSFRFARSQTMSSFVTFILMAGCARTVPVTPPRPIRLLPASRQVTTTSDCLVTDSLPDSACTPGNVNPALTKEVICGPDFHTSDYRDRETTQTEKAQTYAMYKIPRPTNNTGANQQCDLNHLISLELGGSDDLSNIWPECTGFRDKDKFENYLQRMVCAGSIPLIDAQKEISTDWFRYWTIAGGPTR
jgi:hypothetical protein